MSGQGKVWGWCLSVLTIVGACSPNRTDTHDIGTGGQTDGGAAGSGTSNGGTAGTQHAGAGGQLGANAGEAGDGSAGASGERATGGSAGNAAVGGNASGGNASGGDASGGDANAGAGGDASGGEAGALTGPAEFAYVKTIVSGVSACAVDLQSGKPMLVGSPVDKNASAVAIAVDASQRFVFVADDQHVDTYRIGADGGLPTKANSSLATANALTTLALDPQARFAYAGSSAGSTIEIFKIAADTGVLSASGAPVLVGNEALHGGAEFIAADPTGHFVYVSQAFQFGIRGYRVDPASGALSEIAGSPFGASGIPGDHNVFGGALAFAPNGGFLYAVGGALNGFAVDADSGKLTLVDGSPFSLDVQADPNAANLAIDPQGKYLYAAHFLGSNHVSGFAIAPSGALSEVPGSTVTEPNVYSLAVDPSGHFLYVGVDGPQGLAVYSLARESGALKAIDGSAFGIGGPQPGIAFAQMK